MIRDKKILLHCLFLFLLTYMPFLSQHTVQNRLFILFSFIFVLFTYFFKFNIPKFLSFITLICSSLFLGFNSKNIYGFEWAISVLSVLPLLKCFEMKKKRDFYIYIFIIELLLASHLLLRDELFLLFVIFFINLYIFSLLLDINIETHIPIPKFNYLKTIIIFSIPISILFFIFFPRLSSPLKFWGKRIISKTGLSKELRPGDFENLIQDETVKFHAFFPKRVNPSELYWRVNVFQKNEGFNWYIGKNSIEKYVLDDNNYNDQKSYKVIVDRNNSIIPTITLTTNISAISNFRYVQSGALTYSPIHFLNSDISYSAKYLNAGYKLRNIKKERYLQLSESISSKFIKYIESLRLGSNVNQFISLWSDFLTNSNFRYTLKPDPNPRPSLSNLDFFMFDSRNGYCEHYASLTAIVARLSNIPSRVVTGHQGGEYNSYGNFYTIRALDAHAWVELWDQSLSRWVTFDPTFVVAPERITLGTENYKLFLEGKAGFSKEEFNFFKIRYLIESMYIGLNQFFTFYDLDSQKVLLNNIKDVLYRIKQTFLSYILYFIIIMIVVIFVLIYRHQKSNKSLDNIYKIFLKKLAKNYRKKNIWEGPLSYKKFLQREGITNDQLLNIFDLYISLKYDIKSSDKKRLLKLFERKVQNYKP